MEDHVIICRCEEITYGEIKQAIRDGATTLDGIKRVTRAGKGLCQGRCCGRLIRLILNQELGWAPEGNECCSMRPPVRPISIENMMSEKE